MISASLSPNTESDDVLLALKTLFSPWTWQKGEALSEVRRWFDDKITLFSSGRVALFAILKALEIGDATRVIPTVQTSTLLAIILGILLLGEKEHALQKVSAGVIALLGVYFLTATTF